jgi:predicted small metal-binding protein
MRLETLIFIQNIMKTMTCKQLGGACNLEFHANTFEEIAEMSKKHGIEMFQKNDEPHLKAMNEMQELMKSPENMKVWFENKRKEFDKLPDIK